jgi:hypothetical protein
MQMWSIGTVVDDWGKGHAGSCWWTRSGEGRVMGLDWRTRAAEWPATVADTWDTHSREDMVEWTVLLAWSRTGGTRVYRRGGRAWGAVLMTSLVVRASKPPNTLDGGFCWVWASKLDGGGSRGNRLRHVAWSRGGGASRRSNSLWKTWPSDRKPRSWSISPPVEWIGSM